MKFTIKGRIPSKKNQKIIVCRGKFPTMFPSKRHTEWHKDASEQIKAVARKNEPSTVLLQIYFPDLRKADLTNKAESIMDLLVDNKLIKDDSWLIIPCIQLEGYLDRENPRVDITFI